MKTDFITNLLDDLNNVDEDPLSPEELKELMHQRGIPLRHLGKICTVSTLNHTREIAVTEVIARSAKILIKDGLTFLSEDEDSGFSFNNARKCL